MVSDIALICDAYYFVLTLYCCLCLIMNRQSHHHDDKHDDDDDNKMQQHTATLAMTEITAMVALFWRNTRLTGAVVAINNNKDGTVTTQ